MTELLSRESLLGLLNRATAGLLDLDPDGRENLVRLRGKTLCLVFTAPAITLYARPTDDGLVFTPESEDQPDVTLTGSLPAFVRLGARDRQVETLSEGQVRMEGDVETGQAFQRALAALDIDAEELLSRFIGDTPARKLGNVVRGLGDWASQAAERSQENVADYLKEEKRVLVTRIAMEDFSAGVNRTRADVDRLQQRVERLERTLAGRPASS